MNEKRKNSNIILKICLAVLIMIIAIAICLMVLSKRNEENSESVLPVVSSDSGSESSVDFTPESSYEINLKIGETCQAELTDSEFDSKLIWVSSDNDIASVDDYGNITAVSEGTCTVTVVIMDTDQSIAVTVNVSE